MTVAAIDGLLRDNARTLDEAVTFVFVTSLVTIMFSTVVSESTLTPLTISASWR